jgi:hypothetical protein
MKKIRIYTVCGSSVNSSISAVLRNTLPLHIRQSINSNDATLSRFNTPAMKLKINEK